MARHLTSGVVVLADDHPHTQATIDTARSYAGHRYALGHDDAARLAGFKIVDPGRDQPTVSGVFAEAARRGIPWVAVRRDLAPPAELVGQLLEATARRSSKDLPGFVVLLTGHETRTVRRILAVVDRSDRPPSGLMVLAAVAAAEQTGAAVDVLVIGAPDERLDGTLGRDEVLRVARDRDLYEQAKRRSDRLGARATWMFVDHVESRVALVRDVLAADEYDLVVEDLGEINLGGRVRRGARVRRALQQGGQASITLAVLKNSDLPMLLVLDAVRLGLIPAKVKVGAGAGILAMGVLASAAPAAAGPVQGRRAEASISQTVEDYEAALTAAASQASSAEVEAAQAQAHAAVDQTAAIVTGEEQEAAPADEAPTDEAVTGEPQDSAQTSPADLAPKTVTPAEGEQVDSEDVEVASDVSQSDVDEATQAADESEEALDEAQEAFDQAQEAAIEAEAAAADASAQAVQDADQLNQSQAAYEAATGDEQEAALADLQQAGLDADETLQEYQDAATEAVATSADLEEAATEVTTAETQYNQDQATAEATEDAYAEKMATERVSPVAEGEYVESGHYGDAGPYWSTGYHTGEDYAAPIGTDVVAAASGTVVEVSFDDPAYGNRVVIEHEDGYFTTYNHLSSIDVEEGQEVTAGDKIGEVGDTGNSTGAHLHFEVTHDGDGWSSGEFVDPHAWLSGEIG